MRVLHVISTMDPRAGGPVTALVGLASAQARAGIDVSVFSTFRRGDDPVPLDSLRAVGVDIERVGPTRSPLAVHPSIGRVLRRCIAGMDIVHIHMLWEEAQHRAAQESRRAKVPYIIRPCGMLDPWSLAQSRWKKRLYMTWRSRLHLKHAVALHFVSQCECESARRLRLSPASLVEPNGVQLDEFLRLPPTGSFRSRYPRIGRRPIIAFLGRIHPGKGVEHLLPAFAMLRKSPVVRGTDPVLVIAGPDSAGYRAAMELLAHRSGLNGSALFTGMLSPAERVAFLADADLFCLPSDHENFGISVIESLAAGTPTIVSNRVGIHEDLTAAGVGAAVPLDARRLADELARWLADAPMREAAANKCRQFVWEKYNWDRIARRWAAHYTRLVAERSTCLESAAGEETESSTSRLPLPECAASLDE